MTTHADRDAAAFARRISLAFGGTTLPDPAPGQRAIVGPTTGGGVTAAVDAAVGRARAAYHQLQNTDLAARARAIAAVREVGVDNAEDVALLAHEETRIGRYADKVVMMQTASLRTPGTDVLESLYSGKAGSISRQRPAPFGVIASVLPMTVPSEAVISHTIAMVAGGNSVVFMSHPSAIRTTAETVKLCGDALMRAGLPADAVTLVQASGSEAAVELMRHPDIDLLVVTGGAGVVAEAMKVPVKAICAGPGNTPVIVDGTGSLSAAASSIYLGSSFDNTIGCIQEKEVFVPHQHAAELVEALQAQGAYLASPHDLDSLTNLLLTDPKPYVASEVDRDFIGQDAERILQEIGVGVRGAGPRSIVAVVEPDHPFIWSEMLMPVLAICPTASASDALDKALEAEKGNRHSAVVHSRDPEFLMATERALDVNVLVRNSPSFASVGVGSAQPFTVTLASRTGEGPTTARSFVRQHHVIDAIADGTTGAM